MRFIHSLAAKLILILALAAVIPLLFFGIVSVWQARSTTHQSVIVGNQRIAARAADQIDQYVEGTLAILKSVGENIKRADLKDWQRSRIFRNMSLSFPEFSEITLFDANGSVSTTSSIGTPRLSGNSYVGPAIDAARKGENYVSDVFLTDELTPALVASFPLIQLGQVTGIIAAEVDLLHMWRMVGNIRIGNQGYISVVLPGGKLVASGSGVLKKLVLQEKDYPDMHLLERLISRQGDDPAFGVRRGESGDILVSGSRLAEPLRWITVVEQPEREAWALEHRMTEQLILLASFMVVVMILIGYFGGRWKILKPIKSLIVGTRAVADGDLDHRVKVAQNDEFGELAGSFNRMTGDLKLMQDNIRTQERMAMFGRIASGLVHDLKHPVASIENASRLMEKMYDDPEYRETFRRTVNREFEKINSFLANLHTLTHDIPYHPIRLKAKQVIDDVVATFQTEADKRNVTVAVSFENECLMIHADKISVGRALSNIVINGIQATPEGGSVSISVAEISDETGQWVRIEISDTGSGIPPERLETIFGDFVTTKRRGLGLGLALTKRILDQHGARVSVRSEVGKGTSFEILFPKTT